MKSTSMIKQIMNENGSSIVIHLINKEENERGGWYKQVTAQEAMIERLSKRWSNHWYDKKYKTHKTRVKFNRWQDHDEDVHLEQKKRCAKYMGVEDLEKMYPTLVKINHDSVWDFFDYIGYDYKNKKVSNIDTLIFISEK